MSKRSGKPHQTGPGSKNGQTTRTSKYDEMRFEELCSLGSEEVMNFLRSIWAQGVQDFEELSPGEQF
jgi:hypothetical protein